MTEENLKGCIELCTIDGKSFYIDSRFGTIINDLHDYYKKGATSFEAQSVKEVKNIVHIGTAFYVGLIVEESGVDTEINIEVKYFEFDKSFIVRTHDPTKIISAILKDLECAKYLKDNGHPFYISNYSANYNKIPKYIESAWKMYDEKDDKNSDSDEETPKVVSNTWHQKYINKIHTVDEQNSPPKKKRPIKLIGQRVQETPFIYEDDFNWNEVDDLAKNRVRVYEPASDESSTCDSCAGNPDEDPQEESAFTVDDALKLINEKDTSVDSLDSLDSLDALDALNLANQYQEGKSPPRRLLKPSVNNSELHSYVQTYKPSARTLLLNHYDERRRLHEFEELRKINTDRELNRVLQESMLNAQQYEIESADIPDVEKRDDNLN